MPYPKKRAQIFLDESSSHSDHDDDDGDDKDEFNSDDFNSDSDSGSELEDGDDLAEDAANYAEGTHIKASEEKKKTPSMVLSPSGNDGDKDVAPVPIYTQQPSPRSRRYNKRSSTSMSIDSKGDSLAAAPVQAPAPKKSKRSKTTQNQKDNDDHQPRAKRSRLKLDRSNQSESKHEKSKQSATDVGSQDKEYDSVKSDNTYKSVKIVLGGESEKHPIVLEDDDNVNEENDDTGRRKASNKNTTTNVKSMKSNNSNVVEPAGEQETTATTDTKSKKKGKGRGKGKQKDDNSNLKAPSTPGSVETSSSSTVSIATKDALLTQKPLSGSPEQSASASASLSISSSSTATKQDLITQKPLSQSTVVSSSSSSICSPESANTALITQKPLSQTSSTSSITTSKSPAKTITPNKKISKTQSKPSKAKTKKKQTFQSQVLLHLLTTLKPFTLKSLASELRTTSVALNHLMLSMVDKGIVIKRDWGKNKNKELYWIDIPRATKEVYGKEEYNADEDAGARETAKMELAQLKSREIALRREIEIVQQEVSNDELETKLNVEEKVVSDLRERVNGANDRIKRARLGHTNNKRPRVVSWRGVSAQHKPVSMKTTKQIKKEFNQMRIEWKNRKEKCVDFLDNLSDAMEKKPKEVIKLLEIETDEAMGVKLPPKYNI